MKLDKFTVKKSYGKVMRISKENSSVTFKHDNEYLAFTG
jgi:hypothetical protein